MIIFYFPDTTRMEINNDNKVGPTVIVCLGMAGCGKTTFAGALSRYLREMGKNVFIINLDPAITLLPYTADLDIRNKFTCLDIMKEYKIGPNAAIVTCLNLFCPVFLKNINELKTKSSQPDYIILDTPGQIEAFSWSASGNIVLQKLSENFCVKIFYICDTSRCKNISTLISNMLHACSILCKNDIDTFIIFNKIDIYPCDEIIKSLKNYDDTMEQFQKEPGYHVSLMQSLCLLLETIYQNFQVLFSNIYLLILDIWCFLLQNSRFRRIIQFHIDENKLNCIIIVYKLRFQAISNILPG